MYKQIILNLVAAIFLTAILYFSLQLVILVQLLLVGCVVFLLTQNYLHSTLHAPIERRKRIILFISFLTSIFVPIGFLALRIDYNWVLLLFTVLSFYIHLLLVHYFPKLDIDISQLAEELFIIQLFFAVIVEVMAYWTWSLSAGITLDIVKAVSIGIIVVQLLLVSFSLRKKAMIVSTVVFIILAGVKSYFDPAVGVTHLMLYCLFSLMLGYLFAWTRETTETERRFSENINTKIVWIITVGLSFLLITL